MGQSDGPHDAQRTRCTPARGNPRHVASTRVGEGIEHSWDLYEIEDNGLVGFVDARGKVVVPPRYDQSFGFFEGLASEKRGGKWGYIDASGREVISPRFDNTNSFAEGLAWVKIGNRWGYVDRAGKLSLLPAHCAGFEFSGGLAAAGCKGRHGYIDHEFQFVIPLQYDGTMRFSEGLGLVEHGGGYFFITSDGTTACHGYAVDTRYTYAGQYSHGLAGVERDGKWGYIDRSGSWVWQQGQKPTSPRRESPEHPAHQP